MKAKYILVSLLLVALVMGGTGYGVSAGSGDKATGGGTFEHNAFPTTYASPGDKISFGFNAQGQGDGAKGQFHLINHNSGLKISATITYINAPTSTAIIKGTCLIDGTPTELEAYLSDGGEGKWAGWETVQIWLGGTTAFYGQLSKGNVQKHK